MLNEKQKAAVRHTDGPLLVLAGAGSGKTRVITQKIAYLITQCDYPAKSICALTFTNKAAREMQHRLSDLMPQSARRGLHITTFHSLGLRILKREAIHCGLKSGFTIFDSDDSLQVLRGFLPPALSRDNESLQHIQQQISRWKNELITPETALKSETNLDTAHLYQRYQTTLRAYNAVDFDDLICLPVWLMQSFAPARDYWQQRFRHLLIDEYQDSNSSQYALMKWLVADKAQFTAVGDDDQSIYAWRGARPENLLELQRDFPTLKIITLEQNYRSTARILQSANHLIANNPHIVNKSLWSDFGLGDDIRVLSCKHEQDEAEMVVADLISHKLRHRHAFKDYALLYRGNHQSRVFETVLRAQGIPYKISGGTSWFSRAEVKDWFAYLKLLCNETDDAAFLRVINTPKRGIGEATLVALGKHAKHRGQSLFVCCDNMALMEVVGEKPRSLMSQFKQDLLAYKQRLENEEVTSVLKDLITSTGYEGYIYEQSDTPQQAQKRMDNVWQLVDWIGRLMEKKSSLADVVNTLILVDILENAENESLDCVQLMTLHAAKGLEFNFVYLVGMEEGLLPHRVSIEDNQIEEERRLAYVGITRAKKNLTISLARTRRRAGETSTSLPSRFLEELPKDHLQWFGIEGERDELKSKALAKEHLLGLKSLLEA